MKAICYMLILMLATVVASAQSVVPENTFDTRDYLPYGDLFYPTDGVTISWDGGKIHVTWNGQALIVEERPDKFGRLEIFAIPDSEAEEGILPDDFVFIEAFLGVTSLGYPILTINIVYDGRVDIRRVERIDFLGGVLFSAERCECRDGIDMNCSDKDCRLGRTCSAGTSTCYWKPLLLPPVIIRQP